ncbi:transposase [Aureimonas leprariae]|uniref:Transposase n=1 Tax=Plantimonas leprariae TaxID=2615207 RepID=A0A7V7PP16_9HYPH|nr:transposase [Aureimonas leprariae]
MAPLRPGKAGDPGRTGSNNRLFLNGCLWVLRSGCASVLSAGALWPVEDVAPTLQLLVPYRGAGTCVRGD